MIRLHQLATGLVAVALVCSADSHLSAAEVMRYSFDNAADFGENSVGPNGTTMDGAPTASVGMFGGAGNFSSSNTWIQANGLSAANFPTGNATLATWVKDRASGTNNGFTNFGTGSNSHYTWSGGNDGYFNAFRTNRFDNLQYETVVPGYDPTEWHHLSLVNDVDNNEYKVYMDGELAGTKATTAFNLGSQWVGRGHSHRYDGELDEFTLFDTALSQGEIQNLMEFNNTSGAPVAIPEPASILVWLMAGLAIGVTAWRRRNKS